MDTALKPVRACATVVASSYSAWRVYPTLWFPAYAGITVAIVVSLCMVVMFVCRLFLLVVSNGNVIIGVAY